MHVLSFILLLISSVPAIADDGRGLGAYILAGLGGPSVSPPQLLSSPQLPANTHACGDVINDQGNHSSISISWS
jgi:hypothetical protein